MQHHSHRKNQHIDSLSHISSSGPLKKMYELKSWRRRVRNLYRPNPWSDIHIRRIKDTMYEHRLTLQKIRKVKISTDDSGLKKFLKKFSQDKQFIFVGIGVEDILTNLSSQYRGFKMLSSVKTVDLWELAKKNRIYERVEGESIQACLAKNELSVYNQVPKNSRWQSDMDEKHASYKMAVAWASWEVFELEKIALSLHRVKWSPSDRF